MPLYGTSRLYLLQHINNVLGHKYDVAIVSKAVLQSLSEKGGKGMGMEVGVNFLTPKIGA